MTKKKKQQQKNSKLKKGRKIRGSEEGEEEQIQTLKQSSGHGYLAGINLRILRHTSLHFCYRTDFHTAPMQVSTLTTFHKIKLILCDSVCF
jgi:hypothetical protein